MSVSRNLVDHPLLADVLAAPPVGEPHFNYGLQVWIVGGRVDDCHHPARMQPNCCNSHRYAGLTEAEAIRRHSP